MSSSRRLPSLVQLCQRVASNHVENICSLGDEAAFELVAPILQNCSAEALLRFEQATPSLEGHTSGLWKALCFRTYPLPAERRNIDSEPDSWRDEFFVLRDLEAKRLEAVGSKLRMQREELEQRKKDSQIKITDKVPPMKRYRGSWGQPQAPRTLLQKARADAVKKHKGVYGARMLPAMPAAKTFRTLSNNTTTKPPTAAASPAGPLAGKVGTRVTVAAVSKPTPPATSAGQNMSSTPVSSSPARPVPTRTSSTTVPPASSPPSTPRPPQGSPPPIASPSGALKVPVARKNPMASLFMPKHRAYSQLPTHSSSMRSRA
ncbi:RNA polymerase II transcription factor SIII subunit A-domain-containing protein [Phanerochaete sordida]|uniref:RNA polymerase II transcription factor SIII subunit A-domain-containing protein n=1 Tax=Phanerochaete sordida TaxID=48140 RepID=A0A9P3LIR3_9APHY|nr:RNA polymerase II transcription factor SIII subunit A-domain-containing protein [Phanerochaete sordida]